MLVKDEFRRKSIISDLEQAYEWTNDLMEASDIILGNVSHEYTQTVADINIAILDLLDKLCDEQSRYEETK